jgi:hypothetical protein
MNRRSARAEFDLVCDNSAEDAAALSQLGAIVKAPAAASAAKPGP